MPITCRAPHQAARLLRSHRRTWCIVIVLGMLTGIWGCTGAPTQQVDLIIRSGTLYDGSGSKPTVGDVVIRDDRIVHVGPSDGRYRARRIIDAGGRIVAPGFIDPHTHAEGFLFANEASERLATPWLFQGVTTVMIGVDGGGTPEVAQQRARLARGVGVNVGQYVGFGPVRTRVLGEAAREPSGAELARMRALVARGMCQGAFGFSTGLFYPPQSFASTEEVIALAAEAARFGGLYDTHQRDESSYGIGLLDSTREAIRIGREAGLPVHVAHIKALGVDVHGLAGRVIDLIEAARAAGLRVTADQYPWLASGTRLAAALVPSWAGAGGRAALLERLDDPATLDRIRGEMARNLRRRGGADSLLMTATGQPWTGRTLQQMADTWSLDPIDAALRIIRESQDSGDAAASFNMDDADVIRFMRQPWVLTGSDGSAGHPRQYATFPRKYRHYVISERVLTVEEFITRSTGRTADTLGLTDRGYLRAGYFADVVVFDPERFAPRADYQHPRRLSEGVDYLLVNGRLTIDGGRLTAASAGRALARRTGHCMAGNSH